MKNVIKDLETVKSELDAIRSEKIKMHIEKKEANKRDDRFKKLTPLQQKYYDEVMIGLKVYNPQELYHLKENKKKTIHWRFKQAQRVLNLWKQKIIIDYSNYIMEKTQCHLKIIELFAVEPNNNYNCRMTFRELDITRTDIIKVLIANKLLPENFEKL